MEDPKDYNLTAGKVFGLVVAVFTVLGVFALIWAQWGMLQVCATVAFASLILSVILPEDW